MTTRLCDAVRSAPVLPPRARAATILARELLDRLEDDERGPLAALFSEAPEAQRLVAGILAHSPFLTQAMRADPAGLLASLAEPTERRRDALIERARTQAAAATEASELMRLLRRFRRDIALLVALADIGGVWDVETVTGALTDCADLAVRAACDHALRQAAGLNRICLADESDPGAGSGLVVLALGKHGARELNYSSDIDIVVFFDPEMAEAAGVAEPSSFFVRLTQAVARILQERTADGYVFRVDLRLRPDPASTHVAVALPSAYSYYETVGQNWERAAMIKARPVAGDIPLGERFLKDLTPFIWRKYFDFAAIADIHAMKRQIQTVKGHEAIAVAGHNVKLGRGGIREVEFFVQTQQLVFGGRRPALRGRRTLDMLAALVEEGWITEQARDELGQAYRFLRTVEHRLQMRNDEQTQTLPKDDADLDAFARFCGHRSAEAFGKALTAEARLVERHYALLFEEGPSLASEAGTLSFTGADTDPATLETLKRLGFRDPARAAETVRGWHFGRRPAVKSARAREALTELTPALLVALGRSADPDGGLAHLDDAFVRMPAAVELLSLLRSNANLLSLFAEILGSAPRLAAIASHHPHVLDGVIDPAFARAVPDRAVTQARIRAVVGDPPPAVEDALDRLRDAARQENFLVGARLISGVHDAPGAAKAWSDVAESCIAVALDDCRHFFAQDHGVVPGAEIAVIGLGRLGAGALTPTSDLDLMLFYDRPADAEFSDGARPLDPVTWHVRLTQRLVAALTVPTRRGTLYEVDMRLRPSGGKSPVATQFSAFEAYHAGEAELWEEMALTRARFVAGDEALGRRATEAIASILRRNREPARVAGEVASMRALIAREKGEDPDDLKLAPGGLTDLDFLAQHLVLAHAAEHPAVMAGNTAAIFSAAGQCGLIEGGVAERLVAACRLIGDVDLWRRFAVAGADRSKPPPALARRIATAVGRPDAKVLAAELADTRAEVREIFEATLGTARKRR